ncbi:hypothetical protein VaNZ11_010230 [Volvox africanus]|uniref:U-box domain-containing protein n=1 Tax=Volvox africanus TaxID=51714 RepID=A0ABQ5S933_9CHLO|nr:hypothetical protein VaNZ11_010230 [Volvox africanus]
MRLFYRYTNQVIAVLSLILAVEYAIVHRISRDALTRSDVGLSQWRKLLTDCNSTDCPIRHLTLIHDGLYQRAYSIHLLHRVLEISSEDGDPYDAFDVEDDEEGSETADDETSGDAAAPMHVSALPEGLGVPYAYAPGDMLSKPAPGSAALQVAGSRPIDQDGHGSDAAPAVLATAIAEQVPALPLSSDQQKEQDPQQLRRIGTSGVGSSAAAATVAGGDPGASGPGTPPLLQAVVWQPGKVLSVFPWQLRAHFFLSLACTRLYLLMGLWPRAAAVAAAAPRRLRQAAQSHTHVHHFQHHVVPTLSPGQVAHGSDQAAGASRTSGNPASSHQRHGQAQGGHDSVTVPIQHGYGAGGGGFSQAHITAHAYTQHAHGYDGLGSLLDLSRNVRDESGSLAGALSALGRGVPVFLSPEILVEHDVQEDLMASCVFKPAVKNAPGSVAAPGGGGGGGISSMGRPRWRSLPSLLSRWVAHIADRIVPPGARGAATQHPVDRLQGEQQGGGAAAAVSRWLRPGVAQGSHQPQHAYVECRLYRTDRARNASYTCPAVLTVLPSPQRGSGRPTLLQTLQYHQQHQQPPASATSGVGANTAPAGAQSTCPAGSGACPATTTSSGNTQQQQLHGPRLRAKPKLLRRLGSDLRYMTYGGMVPYKWAPILAGILSPHMFLVACLPSLQSLGLMGPFTASLCAYHAVCVILTGADHLLLMRLAAEVWIRARSGVDGPVRRRLRIWMLFIKWLLWDGFIASGWFFRALVMGITTTKQVELWNHLYGTSFRPHPLLSCGLVLPASYMAACATCSIAWRLTAIHQPTSAPLLLFQEGFMSGLASPINSVVYICLAVVGLGGGGLGGGAGGIAGFAAMGARLPLWLLDTVMVSPILTVVALDVMWNMDAAARATPLLIVIVNALRCHQPNEDAAAVGDIFARRARRARGLPLNGGAADGVDADEDAPGAAAAAPLAEENDRGWVLPRAVVGVDGGAAIKHHTSLWMLLDSARWWALHVREAILFDAAVVGAARQRGRVQDGALAAGGIEDHGAAAIWARFPGVIMRVAVAAGNAGMLELPHPVIAGMIAATMMPLGEELWPPRQEVNARSLDNLLKAAAAVPQGIRAGRGGVGAAVFGARAWGEGVDIELDPGLDVALARALVRTGPAPGGEDGTGEEEQPMVRTSDGTVRPLSALIVELRTGMAHVAALRAQLAAVGRGVADLLLLGRWPPPLDLPAEVLNWNDAVPHGFLCPITHSIMTQPALLVSPQLSEASPTYELSAIRQWLKTNRTDPTTGRVLQTYHFIHNDNLRKAIEDWVAERLVREQQLQHPEEQQKQQDPRRRSQEWVVPSLRTQRPRQTVDQTGQARTLLPSGQMSRGTGVAEVGHYHPVEGPRPGQRSVCVGTSEMGLRMRSPERFRGSCAGLDSRGRSQSRGRGAVDDGGSAGGSPIATPGMLARRAVQRAVSRQHVGARMQPQ